MKACIFTEDSSTTCAEIEDATFREYFQGQFLPITKTAELLDPYCETELHIVSDEFGYVRGSDLVENHTDQSSSYEQSLEDVSEALVTEVSETDVVLVLFTTDVFDAVVASNWDDVVAAAKPGSLWCFGAPNSSMESIDITDLEAKGCEVLHYKRVGVAPISSEIRDNLLQKVKGRAQKTRN